MTAGRTHSACPVNRSQFPTSECFLISRGQFKTASTSRRRPGFFVKGVLRNVAVGHDVFSLEYTYSTYAAIKRAGSVSYDHCVPPVLVKVAK